MHDLLSFMPRPRMKHTPPDAIRRTVSDLIDDIQVLANADEIVVLTILAQFAHEERIGLQTHAASTEEHSSVEGRLSGVHRD